MNHLQEVRRLKKRYFVLRHGRSQANVEETIVSSPKIGIPGYGLVEEGRQEVRTSILRALQQGLIDHHVIIHSSDFLRVHQSAETAQEVADIIAGIRLNPKLRPQRPA